MKIVALNLSGFKNFDLETQLNLKDKRNNPIFESESEDKYFIFETILGILFGFNLEEKTKFRKAKTESNVFTGMLTIELSDRTMMIERDFETDFVACILATPKKIKPFFQDKDYVQTGIKRPYLEMLESLFPITNKNLILEICYNASENEPRTLSDLLDTLYLLLSPQMIISEIRGIIQNGHFFENALTPPEVDAPPKEQLEYLNWKKSAIIKILKVDNRLTDIEQGIEKLQYLIQSIHNKEVQTNSSGNDLKKRFPKIHKYNALQLRADVLIWKKLKDEKIQKEVELDNIKTRIRKIERLLTSDFSSYESTPSTFEEDIEKYQNLKKEYSSKKGLIDEIQSKMRRKEIQLNSQKKKKWFVLATIPPILFLASFVIFGPFWLLIIPETLIVTTAILLYFGHISETVRADIFHDTEEKRMLEFRRKEIERELKELTQSNPLFKDEEYLIIHVDRFNKYRKYLEEQAGLKTRQANISAELEDEKFTKTLTDFEKKYSSAINIDRRNIEDFLDEFVQVQEKFISVESGNGTYPEIEEISKLKRKYLISYNDLKSLRDKIISKLKLQNTHIDDALDQTSRKIKNIEMEYEAMNSSDLSV